MKLTGWFSQDKIADNSRVQTPNNANTEQVNRQIRALVPGQTLRGEVVSREGNNAQIRLLQDVLVYAKVDADIRLELGQNITFQVKNNGQTLNLSPLFTNMATEGTVLKALDMASLPVNENTVAMTKQLMDAGLPIDKNTLQQIWKERNAFPDAEILDIVNLQSGTSGDGGKYLSDGILSQSDTSAVSRNRRDLRKSDKYAAGAGRERRHRAGRHNLQ